MMKYAINHAFDFVSPISAFAIGFMQFMGGIGAEMACILFLGSLDSPFPIIIAYAALVSISKVDDFYMMGLSK